MTEQKGRREFGTRKAPRIMYGDWKSESLDCMYSCYTDELDRLKRAQRSTADVDELQLGINRSALSIS